MKHLLLGYCHTCGMVPKTHRPESIGIIIVGRRLKIFLTNDPNTVYPHACDFLAETRSVKSVAGPTLPPDDPFDFCSMVDDKATASEVHKKVNWAGRPQP